MLNQIYGVEYLIMLIKINEHFFVEMLYLHYDVNHIFMVNLIEVSYLCNLLRFGVRACWGNSRYRSWKIGIMFT
jgi:hypothetical protein